MGGWWLSPERGSVVLGLGRCESSAKGMVIWRLEFRYQRAGMCVLLLCEFR